MLTATLLDASRVGTEGADIQSSDASILKVENGAVTARKPGLCLVTMTMDRNGIRKQSCLPFLVRE